MYFCKNINPFTYEKNFIDFITLFYAVIMGV